MKRLNEDIKTGQFKSVYLLYGEESYLRRQYKDKLKAAMVNQGDTMNYSYFEGKSISIPSLIDLGETLPFLANKRVIMVEDSGLLKTGGEDLAEYMKQLPESTCFIFVEREADKRTKLFKAISAAGLAVELSRQEEDVLKRWMAGLLKKEGKTMSSNTAELLLEKAGTDMVNIAAEMEKLICYCMDKDIITDADVEAVCTQRVSNQIFDMVNSVADKKLKEALQYYYDLLTLKEAPMRILFLIARQYHLLLQVKLLCMAGTDTKQIALKTGLHTFVTGKYIAQAKKFTKEALRQAVELCVESEEAVKTGKLNEKLCIELLLVTLCNLNG